MKISVVMPVYNEVRTIREVVARVREVLSGLAGDGHELIIVDDASSDGSGALLAEICAELDGDGVVLLRHERNRGKGAALRTGFARATGDVLLVQDADLEMDPGHYPQLIAPIAAGESEVVYGSRFLDPSGEVPRLTRLANRFLTGLTNLVTGLRITDMETCYKVLRRTAFERLTLRSDRFGFEPELTVKIARLGLAIHEVPVSYQARSRAEGKKINWKDGVKAVGAIFWFRFFD